MMVVPTTILSRPWISATRGIVRGTRRTPSCNAPFRIQNRTHNTDTTTTSSNSSSTQILLDRNDHSGIATVTLHRPNAANAMGSTMLRELTEIIHTLEQPQQANDSSTTVRCLVVTSSSHKVFSAGADLKERATMTPDDAMSFVTKLRTTMERFARLPMPTIAAIEGVALGGGLELALAADLRVAGRDATMGLPETTLAIVPGAGGTQRLPRLIGVARAKELIYTGRRLDAAMALEYGIVQHVVDAGEAESKATELAKQIASNGPLAIRAAKEAIDLGMESSNMANALFIERRCYGRTIPTEDRLEGLVAFQEGRSPAYNGK